MKNIFLRILGGLPDSLDRVIFSLFMVNVVLTSVKLILAIPDFKGDPDAVIVMVIALLGYAVITGLLLLIPQRLFLWTKIGLLWMAIYPFAFVLASGDPVNLPILLHVWIVIMLAYYCIGRRWGLAFSIVYAASIVLYMWGVESGKYQQVLLFSTFTSFQVALSLVLISFGQLSFIHYLYNRARTKTMNEIRTLNEKLNKSLAAKSEFLSTMSHELRTPLNSLMGTAYLLVNEDQNDLARKENLTALKRSAEHLLTLINNVLDFSVMDATSTRLEHVSFSAATVLTQSADVLKPKALEKGLKFRLHLDESAYKVELIGDPTRLRQIIFNLLDNAIRFTSSGSVDVDVRILPKSDTKVVLSARITDTGIGIDPQNMQAIFEPFSAFRNTEFGGTGIGLTIVKHLMELHQGDISVDSQPGIGSTFHIFIPYDINKQVVINQISSSSGSVAASKTTIAKRNLSHLRLLLAEDNQMSVIFMKQLLKKWEIEPVIAIDGQQVVDLIQGGETFDIILMDIRMPKMTGLEATTFIREFERDSGHYTQIIALTASVTGETTRQLDAVGFDEYLSKPFAPNDLLHKLEKLLNL